MLFSIPTTQKLLPTSSKSYTTTYIHLYFWSLAICKVIYTKYYIKQFVLWHKKSSFCATQTCSLHDQTAPHNKQVSSAQRRLFPSSSSFYYFQYLVSITLAIGLKPLSLSLTFLIALLYFSTVYNLRSVSFLLHVLSIVLHTIDSVIEYHCIVGCTKLGRFLPKKDQKSDNLQYYTLGCWVDGTMGLIDQASNVPGIIFFHCC